MVISAFMFDLNGCVDNRSVEDWASWFRRAQASVPKIWPHEENVLGVWSSFQEINRLFRNWSERTAVPLMDRQPAMQEFVALQSKLHEAILEASFPIETAAGLAVLLSIKSTSLRFRDAPKEDYDAALEWAAFEASRLTIESPFATTTQVSAAIPNDFVGAQERGSQP